MKKLIYLFFMLTFTITLNAQETDIIIYGAGNNINFYSLNTNTDHTGLLELGPTPNQIYYYNNRVFVVNSGNTGANTNVQIIPIESFYNFENDLDTTAFRNSATQIMLEDNGNAYTAVGLTDSTVLVTLAQSAGVQEVNYLTNTISPVVTVASGNPQASSEINETQVAFTVADWNGAGVGNVSVFDKTTGTITKTIPTHINNVGVDKLMNGDLLSTTWGTWFGDGNFGTIEYIDGQTLEVTATLFMQDSAKASYIIELNDSTVYVEGFDPAFTTVRGIVNPVDVSYTPVTTGFFSKHIVGKLHNGNILVGEGSVTEVYNTEFNLVTTIPINFGTKNLPIIYPSTVPVELTSFSGSLAENGIILNWVTATETNNSGFEIEKRTLINTDVILSGDEGWNSIGFVNGNGNSSSVISYSFLDNEITTSKVNYRLKQIDYDGTITYSNVIEIGGQQIESFNLSQNYPNPFNPTTTIEYTIPEISKIELRIYNSLGQEVKTLVNSSQSAGNYKINFDASELSSGIYFYILNAQSENGSFTNTKKMILLK